MGALLYNPSKTSHLHALVTVLMRPEPLQELCAHSTHQAQNDQTKLCKKELDPRCENAPIASLEGNPLIVEQPTTSLAGIVPPFYTRNNNGLRVFGRGKIMKCAQAFLRRNKGEEIKGDSPKYGSKDPSGSSDEKHTRS
ncbi:hypothetical protein ACFE04_023514 [Oxalis oulophora]